MRAKPNATRIKRFKTGKALHLIRALELHHITVGSLFVAKGRLFSALSWMAACSIFGEPLLDPGRGLVPLSLWGFILTTLLTTDCGVRRDPESNCTMDHTLCPQRSTIHVKSDKEWSNYVNIYMIFWERALSKVLI